MTDASPQPGQSVLFSADQVQPLAIVLNELPTDADALPDGVSQGGSVGWALNEGILAIEIIQRGQAPRRVSTADFSARIVEQVVNRQLRGSLVKERRADDEVTKLLLPLGAL